MTNIEKNVMRRVRTIHLLRPVASGATASCLLLLLALWGIGREVWVGRVFENMPHSGDVVAIAQFYFSAFVNTQIIVQTLSLVTLGALVYLARETARLITGILPRLRPTLS